MVSGGKDTTKEPKVKKRPGRVPTACAECRRLKLRCDKKVPCEKCVSRGCASICPDGALTPGKGNRLILANTEELHDQLDQLRARNRDLEGALKTLHESVSDQPHPLLQQDLLPPLPTAGPSTFSTSPSRKSSASTPAIFNSTVPPLPPPGPRSGDDPNPIDNLGTLITKDKGSSTYIGRTARPDVLSKFRNLSRETLPRISEDITSAAFPDLRAPDPNLLSKIGRYLPLESEAGRLCDLYLEYGKYLYLPLSRKYLSDEILTPIYTNRNLSQHYPHALPLLFSILAIASLLDPDKEAYSTEAHEYYQLSRASFNITAGHLGTTLTSIQILMHLSSYLELSDSQLDDADSAWVESSKAVQLAFSAGLHLNATRWNLLPETIRRRNNTMLQLFILDTWTSFHIGRPPSLTRAYTDNFLHGDSKNVSGPVGSSQPDFHRWRFEFATFVQVVMESSGPRQPTYTAILDYDRRIRNFNIPREWRMPCDTEPTPSAADIYAYRWIVLSSKEIALLNLHRPYCMQALQESPSDLQRHRYLPSVVAACRSAWRLVTGLAMAWKHIPQFLARISTAWSYSYSAGIIFCLLAVRSPSLSHLMSTALDRLDELTTLFDSASSSCRFASTHSNAISRLRRKAHEAAGSSASYRFRVPDNATISTPELERLAGKTTVVSGFGAGGTIVDPGSSCAEPIGHSRATSVTISDTAMESPPHMSTFSFGLADSLHPTLVHDLKEFSMRRPLFSAALAFDDEQEDLTPRPTTTRNTPQVSTHSHTSSLSSHSHLHPEASTSSASPVPLMPGPISTPVLAPLGNLGGPSGSGSGSSMEMPPPPPLAREPMSPTLEPQKSPHPHSPLISHSARFAGSHSMHYATSYQPETVMDSRRVSISALSGHGVGGPSGGHAGYGMGSSSAGGSVTAPPGGSGSGSYHQPHQPQHHHSHHLHPHHHHQPQQHHGYSPHTHASVHSTTPQHHAPPPPPTPTHHDSPQLQPAPSSPATPHTHPHPQPHVSHGFSGANLWGSGFGHVTPAFFLDPGLTAFAEQLGFVV